MTAPELEPLGRGGGLRFAAAQLRGEPPVFALNADDAVALDDKALLAQHEERGAAATITVTPMQSPFGVVDVADGDIVTGFREAPRLPLWISCGIYVSARRPSSGSPSAETTRRARSRSSRRSRSSTRSATTVSG